jgi:hypothetical protein
MSNESIRNFLAQFSASEKKVNEWPSWMRESARMASASFPKLAGEDKVEHKKPGSQRSRPATSK